MEKIFLIGGSGFIGKNLVNYLSGRYDIFVIDKGGILEQGSPAELMEKKGAYYKLYMAQFAELG